LTYPLKMKNN